MLLALHRANVSEKTATSSELMMEGIVRSGEQTCMLNLSQKGLSLST